MLGIDSSSIDISEPSKKHLAGMHALDGFEHGVGGLRLEHHAACAPEYRLAMPDRIQLAV
jgi:hypothetical protein